MVAGGVRPARQASGPDSCSGVRSWHLLVSPSGRLAPPAQTIPSDVDGLSLAISARIDRKQKLRAVRSAMENSWLAHPRLDLKDGRQSTRILDKNLLPALGALTARTVECFHANQRVASRSRHASSTAASVPSGAGMPLVSGVLFDDGGALGS